MNTKIFLLSAGKNLKSFPDNCKLIGVFTEQKKAIVAARFLVSIHAKTNMANYSDDAVVGWIDAQIKEITETGRTSEGRIAFQLKESYTDVIDADDLGV